MFCCAVVWEGLDNHKFTNERRDILNMFLRSFVGYRVTEIPVLP